MWILIITILSISNHLLFKVLAFVLSNSICSTFSIIIIIQVADSKGSETTCYRGIYRTLYISLTLLVSQEDDNRADNTNNVFGWSLDRICRRSYLLEQFKSSFLSHPNSAALTFGIFIKSVLPNSALKMCSFYYSVWLPQMLVVRWHFFKCLFRSSLAPTANLVFIISLFWTP